MKNDNKLISLSETNKYSEKSKINFSIERIDKLASSSINLPIIDNRYEILLIIKGNCFNIIDNQEFQIPEKTLFFIIRDNSILCKSSKDFDAYRILFTEEFLIIDHPNKNILFELFYLNNFFKNQFLKLKNLSFEQINIVVELLYNEFINKEKSDVIIRSLLIVLLTKIQRIVNSEHNNLNIDYNIKYSYIEIFNKFKNLLEQNYKKNMPVIYYSEQLNITPQHLNRVVKAITSYTTSEIIKNRTIIEVKRLLLYSSLSISEIAQDLNFFDTSHFTKYFKKITNVSPIKFRQGISDIYKK